MIGGVLLYARAELFDPSSLGDNAGTALADEDVRIAISPTIAEAIGQVSPEDEPTVAEVAAALEDPRVAASFEVAAGAAARRLFGRGEGTVDLDLADVAATAIAVTEDASVDELGLSQSDFESARLDLISGRAVLDVLETAERIGWVGLILAPLGALALLLSVLLAFDRLRALSAAAVAVAVVSVLLLAAIYVGREIALAQFDDELTRDAVSGAWDALLGGLRTGAVVVAGAAVVVAIGSGAAAARARPRH